MGKALVQRLHSKAIEKGGGAGMGIDKNELLVRLGLIAYNMDMLYAEKRQIEQQLKAYASDKIEECGRTGKTINELEE